MQLQIRYNLHILEKSQSSDERKLNYVTVRSQNTCTKLTYFEMKSSV